MGVLRPLGLACALLGGCADVVVDPFVVDEMPPPPPPSDLVLVIDGLGDFQMRILAVSMPELGIEASTVIVEDTVTMSFPDAVERGRESVLLAGQLDLDGDGCCTPMVDLAFFEMVRLTAVDDDLSFGRVMPVLSPEGSTCELFPIHCDRE
jgi:hypothetical protein